MDNRAGSMEIIGRTGPCAGSPPPLVLKISPSVSEVCNLAVA